MAKAPTDWIRAGQAVQRWTAAAEILRYTPGSGWTEANTRHATAFVRLMLPTIDIPTPWMSQSGYATDGTISAAVFLDDVDLDFDNGALSVTFRISGTAARILELRTGGAGGTRVASFAVADGRRRGRRRHRRPVRRRYGGAGGARRRRGPGTASPPGCIRSTSTNGPTIIGPVTTDLRLLAADTLRILDTGSYRAPHGRTVEIGAALRVAIDGTLLHEPADQLPARPPVGGGSDGPVVSVTGESTLAGARRLARDGDVAALVFASAKHPGGGFRTGARAQEEDVARASGLYRCLTAAPRFYTYHRDNIYSDRVVYSPGVPVFRDDHGNLLDEPYLVSFLTAAAPNRGAVPRDRAAQVAQALDKRARRVLAVATAHGHRRLVLGAWGCGVFRNDPATVAEAFAVALAEQTARLDEVVFAIMDKADSPTRAAFADRFR